MIDISNLALLSGRLLLIWNASVRAHNSAAAVRGSRNGQGLDSGGIASAVDIG